MFLPACESVMISATASSAFDTHIAVSTISGAATSWLATAAAPNPRYAIAHSMKLTSAVMAGMPVSPASSRPSCSVRSGMP